MDVLFSIASTSMVLSEHLTIVPGYEPLIFCVTIGKLASVFRTSGYLLLNFSKRNHQLYTTSNYTYIDKLHSYIDVTIHNTEHGKAHEVHLGMCLMQIPGKSNN